MAVNRVEDSDLILSFPVDTIRGVTETYLDALCINITKQAFTILYGAGSYVETEMTLIDNEDTFALIQAAVTRIAEEMWLCVHKRRPVPTLVLNEEERLAIAHIQQWTYVSAEDTENLES